MMQDHTMDFRMVNSLGSQEPKLAPQVLLTVITRFRSAFPCTGTRTAQTVNTSLRVKNTESSRVEWRLELSLDFSFELWAPFPSHSSIPLLWAYMFFSCLEAHWHEHVYIWMLFWRPTISGLVLKGDHCCLVCDHEYGKDNIKTQCGKIAERGQLWGCREKMGPGPKEMVGLML